MSKDELYNMRESYQSSFLLEEDCHSNPFVQFKNWFSHAVEIKIPEPNAMTIATVGKDGQPSARMVLLKDFSDAGFSFYTNYDSHKGKQIQENSKVALLFWWAERQIRIEGIVQKIDRNIAEQYFHSRPKESQIGAIASPQSQVLESRAILDNRYKELEEKYISVEVPLPDNWGGFLVIPQSIEFWQGRVSRLHDRIQYTRLENNAWKINRLAP